MLHVAINHAAGLNKLRNDKTVLHALDVRVGGAAMAITGKVESGGVSVSAEVDSAHEVPVETTRVASVSRFAPRWPTSLQTRRSGPGTFTSTSSGRTSLAGRRRAACYLRSGASLR